MEVQISQIKVGDRVRKDMGDIAALASDIDDTGQLQAIGIDSNYKLLFGERRLRAIESLGRDTIKAEIHSNLNTAILALKAERSENNYKPWTPSEAVEIARRLEAVERAEAKERQQATQLKPGENSPGSGKLPAPEKGDTRDKVGQAVGMSGKTYEKAKAVVEAAEENPEEYGELVEKMDSQSVDAAHKALKSSENRKERIANISKISSGNRDMNSDVLYPVIYADPPWRYEHVKTESRAIENQYPTMPLDEICALKVPAADNSILFLWTTSPKLEEGLRVLNSWGFTYRTCAIWDKEKIGMGYYFRQRHELLLVGTKGNIPTPKPENRPASVFSYKRGEHSEKPVEVANYIEDMYPELDKIELFCRAPRDGWAVWGNQSGA